MKSTSNPGAVSPPLPSSAESAGGVACSFAASDPRALARDELVEKVAREICYGTWEGMTDDRRHMWRVRANGVIALIAERTKIATDEMVREYLLLELDDQPYSAWSVMHARSALWSR